MPHRFVAPFVGVLQPRLEEVQARSKSCQNQHRHKQVEGHEPVQEQPRHTAVTVGTAKSLGLLVVGAGESQSSHSIIHRSSSAPQLPLLHWRCQKRNHRCSRRSTRDWSCMRLLHPPAPGSDVQRRVGVAMATSLLMAEGMEGVGGKLI